MVEQMTWRILTGDALEQLGTLPAESVQCCVTSPPYWGLRDYGVEGQLGMEKTPEEYVARMVEVFREVRRVLRDDGTLWLNLGDRYMARQFGWGTKNDRSWAAYHREAGDERKSAPRTGHEAEGSGEMCRRTGLKPKDLVGIPWRVAFALQADGWWLRSDIIWSKPNPMPESVTDRPTKAHEYLFLLTKSKRYFYDADAIVEDATNAGGRAGYAGYSARAVAMGREPSGNEKPGVVALNGDTRNRRTVWTIPTQPFPGAHFAVMPPAIVEPCILAGAPFGATVLDPFTGAGTVGVVALRLGRSFVGIELNPEYVDLASRRIHDDAPLLNQA